MIEDLVAQNLDGIRCDSILDVGPGYAEFSRIAARVTGATSITFADCDPAVLSWQARRCRDEGVNARLLTMLLDSRTVRSINERFGVIHCQEVLEHLSDASETLRALAALLLPGGRIVITVPTHRSERVLRFLNPSYMRNEPHGHVNEFDETALRDLVREAGLSVLVFAPVHPQFFVAHSWLVATRMKLEGSTGKILTGGVRGFVFGNLLKYSRFFFGVTGLRLWSYLLPRNYFVVAGRHEDTR
jgi:SAM-dependent methyltransferase